MHYRNHQTHDCKIPSKALDLPLFLFLNLGLPYEKYWKYLFFRFSKVHPNLLRVIINQSHEVPDTTFEGNSIWTP